MMKKIEIKNFNKAQIDNMLVLLGRKLGYDMRKFFKFDDLDKDNEKYSIVFPNNILSLSTSFFLALFGDSVRTIGSKEKFKEKYSIKCNSNLDININDGINDALNNVDGLS